LEQHRTSAEARTAYTRNKNKEFNEAQSKAILNPPTLKANNINRFRRRK
jgi:hypothetical protein